MSPDTSFARKVVNAIAAAVGPGPVALHEPYFAGNEWVYLKQCLDSTFVSSVGKFVDRFEADLAQYTGSKYAIAVVNGTAALHIALRMVGVKYGDEVLLPALTFVATANAVTYCGATPHFVDCEENTLGVDPHALREYLERVSEIRGGQCINRNTGKVIRALIPMHVFGHPMNIDGALGLARDFRLALVEDAAESLGSTVSGRHTGTFGQMGTLSFNGNKTITTGGGGAILTDDPELARHAKHVTTTAKLPHRWEYRHDEIGFNYRLPNINAALGCAQLEQLPNLLMAKRRVLELYQCSFSEVKQARIFQEPKGCHSNYWLQTLLLDEAVSAQRDEILEATNELGLMTRPSWTLMHRLPHFKGCPRMEVRVAEAIDRRLINLPSSAQLGMRK